MKRRIYLTFPTKLVTEPIVCEMYDALGVRFNLRTASVNDEIGIIGMELDGEPDRVEAAMSFFRARGVRVEPIELDVIAGYMALSEDQIRRYSRHVLLPELGGVAQAKLLGGAVAIARLDAAGQAAALYLAAAGVGRLVVSDERLVDAPGPLFESADVGRSCREAARDRLAALNGDCRVVDAAEAAFALDATGEGVEGFAQGAAAARRAIRALAGVRS